jgi:hypothetical protein
MSSVNLGSILLASSNADTMKEWYRSVFPDA